MIQLIAGLIFILFGSMLVVDAGRPQTAEIERMKELVATQSETIAILEKTAKLSEANFATLREMADRYKRRAEHPNDYGNYAPPWHDAEGNPIPGVKP